MRTRIHTQRVCGEVRARPHLHALQTALLVRERVDDITQREQPDVDVNALPHARTLRLRREDAATGGGRTRYHVRAQAVTPTPTHAHLSSLQALRAGQVHKGEFRDDLPQLRLLEPLLSCTHTGVTTQGGGARG